MVVTLYMIPYNVPLYRSILLSLLSLLLRGFYTTLLTTRGHLKQPRRQQQRHLKINVAFPRSFLSYSSHAEWAQTFLDLNCCEKFGGLRTWKFVDSESYSKEKCWCEVCNISVSYCLSCQWVMFLSLLSSWLLELTGINLSLPGQWSEDLINQVFSSN